MCRIYRRDYECLGYPWPKACSPPACALDHFPVSSTSASVIETSDTTVASSSGAMSSARDGDASLPHHSPWRPSEDSSAACASNPLAPLPFTAAHIQACTRTDPWLREYACSACLSGPCRAGHLLSSSTASQGSMTCDDAFMTLRNVSVAFVGDSLTAHLLALAQCFLPGVRTRWSYFALKVLPHQKDALAALLREALAVADVVIFGWGAWYHWDGGGDGGAADADLDAAGPALTEEEWRSWAAATTKMMEACAARRLPPPRTELGSACGSAECLQGAPSTDRERAGYAARRRLCKGTLGKRAYVSDLALFASTLCDVAGERPWRARRLIWWDGAQQHYNTTSGMFPAQHGLVWPSGSGACVPHRRTNLANERNALARRVLAPLLAKGEMQIWSTARHDAAAHDQHADRRGGTMRGDCSHYCLHSEVSRNWLEELLDPLRRWP